MFLVLSRWWALPAGSQWIMVTSQTLMCSPYKTLSVKSIQKQCWKLWLNWMSPVLKLNYQDKRNNNLSIIRSSCFISLKWSQLFHYELCWERWQITNTHHTHTDTPQSVLFIEKQWLNESTSLREVVKRGVRGTHFLFHRLDWGPGG